MVELLPVFSSLVLLVTSHFCKLLRILLPQEHAASKYVIMALKPSDSASELIAAVLSLSDVEGLLGGGKET